jgi:hypothetical protein
MQVGDQIEHYMVVEHIGRGGMADVWSARDERLHRTVAIKTIMADVSNEKTRMQFEHEARTIAALEHSNILPIYDFGEFQRQLYIVMRFVSGGSLLDRIVDRGGLADDEIIMVGQAVARALERAHAESIVHRDLKPANVLLDRFGTPYLADFGLASVAGVGEDENISSGTLIYMPPEQMFGEPVDHRADIYAFAITLFQMITGEFPFDGQGALCLRQAQQGDELPDPRRYRPNIPEQVVSVLRIATAQDTEARFDSATLFMAEITAALQGQTVHETGAGAPEVGPAQEPVPYTAHTEPTVDEDMIVTMPGHIDEALLATVDYDSAALAGLPADSMIDGVGIGAEDVEADTLPNEPPGRGEARQLFRRMVRAWARGQGRFLTGATHFANIHDFYSQPEIYDLTIDDAGCEAMLRGAIEHQYALDYWLPRVPDLEVRRIILFHALRSDLAAARALAVELLRDVPDGETIGVATTVGRLLHSETSPSVRYAVVDLLNHRGERVANWRHFAFSMDTDLLLAEQAIRTDSPEVAELAARTIGRLRSRAAVMHIVEAFAAHPAAVRSALAWIRDEADSLPGEVPPRLRAWTVARLTVRYLSANVGRLGLRFFLALLGTGIGLGIYVDVALPSSAILELAHLYRVVANAQTFGLLAGLGGMLAAALPLRLAGSAAAREDGATLWSWWTRLLVAVVFGTLFGTIAYLNFQVLALQFTDPKLEVVMLGGLGLALGAAVAATFRWPLVIRLLVTALTPFAALYLAWQLYLQGTTDAIIFLRGEEQLWLFVQMAVLAALGIWGPELLQVLFRLLCPQRQRAAEAPAAAVETPAVDETPAESELLANEMPAADTRPADPPVEAAERPPVDVATRILNQDEDRDSV